MVSFYVCFDVCRDNLELQQSLKGEKEKNENLTKELNSLKEELMTEKTMHDVEKKSNLQVSFFDQFKTFSAFQ